MLTFSITLFQEEQLLVINPLIINLTYFTMRLHTVGYLRFAPAIQHLSALCLTHGCPRIIHAVAVTG